jgi:integrase/recombinase XerC
MAPSPTTDKQATRERVGNVTIYQRGAIWQASFQHNGRQQRVSLETRSKKEARLRAAKLAGDVVAGKYAPPVPDVSIEQVVQQQLEYLRAEGRAKKTLQKCEGTFKRLVEFADSRGVKHLSEVNLALVDAYRANRAAEGRKPKTIHNETVLIRQLVNFALRRELIAEDPLKQLKLKLPKPTPQPCWTWNEVELILRTAKSPQREALMLLADTGMRVGELRYLTWDDVDMEQRVLRIRPKDDWRPKTGDQRAIPMSARVCAVVQSLRKRGRWLFTARPSKRYPEGGHQINERRLLESLKRVLKQLELPGHLHTFRHSFISNALLTGTPEPIVRSWVGHVDAQIMRTYTHVADQESRAAMQRLDAKNSPTKAAFEESREGDELAHFQHSAGTSEKRRTAK